MALGTYRGIEIRPGTDADVSQQIQQIDRTKPVPALALPTDEKPIEVKQPTPATGSTYLSNYIAGSADQFLQGLDKQAAQAKTGMDAPLSEYVRSLLTSQGQASLTDQAYRDEGVNDAQAALRDISGKILAEKNAAQNTIEDLKKNQKGLFGGGLEQAIQDVQDKSNSRLADFAVQQYVAQGNYEGAREIADRAVAAKVEQQQNYNDALKFIYENAKDTFDKADQRAFEAALDDRNRKLDMDAYKEKARYDQIIKQSDPLYQAQVAAERALANQRAALASGGTATLNGKPQTAVQSQVQGYADRTNQSDAILSKIGSKFTGLSSYLGGLAPNIFKSSERQQFEQAQRDFVNAVLRRESGAAISPSEFENAQRQYFPQPGDSAAVVQQKAANRATVINNLYQQANIQRGALPGQVIEDADGTRYQVGDDGITLIPL